MSVERVVVLGASAGGVKALEDVVAGLPGDLRAAVLVVLHVSPDRRSLLPEILARAAVLGVAAARDGEPLRQGRIYVAPPDHHLLATADRVRVVQGPRENHYRPSIDVLFRSAAYAFGSRAIGVVLSGSLSDGSSGLYAIKRLGGIAITQDPEDAAYSSMPLSALRRVDVDHARPAAEIGALIASLVQERPGAEPADAAEYRRGLRYDITIAAAESPSEQGIVANGQPSSYTCPECSGVLFRVKEGATDRFRCHTGHGFSSEALLEEYTDTVEATLWQALAHLQETTAFLKEAAARLRESGSEAGADEIAAKAHAVEKRLHALRRMALDNAGLGGRSGEDGAQTQPL